MNNEIQKVGLEAFNELAESHDAHVKEVKRLSSEVKKLKLKIKLLKDFWNSWDKG
jgi:cell division protein FtsB